METKPIHTDKAARLTLIVRMMQLVNAHIQCLEPGDVRHRAKLLANRCLDAHENFLKEFFGKGGEDVADQLYTLNEGVTEALLVLLSHETSETAVMLLEALKKGEVRYEE